MPTRDRLLDAALDVLGGVGARGLTLRAVESAAKLPHGSIRHHFGDRQGLLRALFDHLADVESRAARANTATGDAPADRFADILAQWLGPGRQHTLARYELFLLAARDPALQPALANARAGFEAIAADAVCADRAATVVAALDGLLLDALVRGRTRAHDLRGAIAQLL